MKYHDHDEHINKDFGFNRLNERFKTCMKCRQYKLDNRELILQQGRERAKEYYKEHRSEILENSKEYKNNNKAKINEKIKYNVCGSLVSRHGIARHRSNKCMKANSIE